MISVTDATIQASDGLPLAATILAPEGRAPDAVAILNSATAVPRKIYKPFASALAVRGVAVVTYDYRGVGGSAPASLKGYKARMRDWALLDAAGAQDFAERTWPGAPLLGLGHSFGGQAFALMPGNARFRRIAMIAAQAGALRLLEGFERWKVTALLGAVAPAATALAGYMPGKRLGLGEDMPAGVLSEWRRWCFSRDYFYGDASLGAAGGAARVTAPVLAVGLADDPWARPAAIDLLTSRFVSSAVTRLDLTPAQADVRKIGHFGFFRAEHQKTSWPRVTDWLLA
jgi:predicted alpha/beta hydrolase